MPTCMQSIQANHNLVRQWFWPANACFKAWKCLSIQASELGVFKATIDLYKVCMISPCSVEEGFFCVVKASWIITTMGNDIFYSQKSVLDWYTFVCKFFQGFWHIFNFQPFLHSCNRNQCFIIFTNIKRDYLLTKYFLHKFTMSVHRGLFMVDKLISKIWWLMLCLCAGSMHWDKNHFRTTKDVYEHILLCLEFNFSPLTVIML